MYVFELDHIDEGCTPHMVDEDVTMLQGGSSRLEAVLVVGMWMLLAYRYVLIMSLKGCWKKWDLPYDNIRHYTD